MDAAGVKDVRIGMDGQTHPSTRVVVDLEKACSYELTPGPAGKLVLTLHAKAAAAAPEVAANPAELSIRIARGGDASRAAPRPKRHPPSPLRRLPPRPTIMYSWSLSDQAKSNEPTVRAEEAASRFSDKTAAELIPVSMHAAQAQNSAHAFSRPSTLRPSSRLKPASRTPQPVPSTRGSRSRST